MNAEDKIRGALFVLDGGDRLLDLPHSLWLDGHCCCNLLLFKNEVK